MSDEFEGDKVPLNRNKTPRTPSRSTNLTALWDADMDSSFRATTNSSELENPFTSPGIVQRKRNATKENREEVHSLLNQFVSSLNVATTPAYDNDFEEHDSEDSSDRLRSLIQNSLDDMMVSDLNGKKRNLNGNVSVTIDNIDSETSFIDLDEVRQNTELNRNINDQYGGAKAPTGTPDLEMVQMGSGMTSPKLRQITMQENVSSSSLSPPQQSPKQNGSNQITDPILEEVAPQEQRSPRSKRSMSKLSGLRLNTVSSSLADTPPARPPPGGSRGVSQKQRTSYYKDGDDAEGDEGDCVQKVTELITERTKEFYNADTSDELCAVFILFCCHLTIVLMMLVGYIRTAHEIRDHHGHTHLADLLLSYFILYGTLIFSGCCSYGSHIWCCNCLISVSTIGIIIVTIYLFVDFFDMTTADKIFMNNHKYFWGMYKAFIYSHIGVLCLAIFGAGCVVGWAQRSPLFDYTRGKFRRLKAKRHEFSSKNYKICYPCCGIIALVHTIICIITLTSYLNQGCRSKCDCANVGILLDAYFFHFFASPFFLFLCTPLFNFGKPDFRHSSFTSLFGLSFMSFTCYFIFEYYGISDSCEKEIIKYGSQRFYNVMGLFAGWNLACLILGIITILIFLCWGLISKEESNNTMSTIEIRRNRSHSRGAKYQTTSVEEVGNGGELVTLQNIQSPI